MQKHPTVKIWQSLPICEGQFLPKGEAFLAISNFCFSIMVKLLTKEGKKNNISFLKSNYISIMHRDMKYTKVGVNVLKLFLLNPFFGNLLFKPILFLSFFTQFF